MKTSDVILLKSLKNQTKGMIIQFYLKQGTAVDGELTLSFSLIFSRTMENSRSSLGLQINNISTHIWKFINILASPKC